MTPVARVVQPNAKSESLTVGSDEPTPRTSGFIDIGASPLRFDLEKTFPAILAPFALLRKIPESQDVDALRALGTVFSHCLDAIVYSTANLEHLSTSSRYHTALNGVNFSKDLFLGHVNHIPQRYDQPTCRQEAIRIAMHLLDMSMSNLRGFLNVAAFEAAQLKPLPQLPTEGELAQVPGEPEVLTSVSQSPTDSHPVIPNEGTCASNSMDTPDLPQGFKVSAFLKPFREKIKRKPSRLDLSAADCPASSKASSTLVDSDGSGDLSCGYVHVSVNVCSSLAQLPVSIDPTVGRLPHPEDETELWKDRKGLAQLASLKALVRYMTSPDADNDVEIIDVFFLCFRFFSSPQETLDAFVARYDEELPCQPLSVAQSHAMQVKVRIARLLYLWVVLHWRVEDSEVLSPLTQFIFTRLSQDIPQEASSQLVSSLHQCACAGEKSRGLRKERTIARAEAKYRQDVLCSTWEPREKKSMMRRNFSKVKLEHFHSPGGHAMLALQMTLLLWEKYRTFEPEDAVRYLMARNGDGNPPTSEVARKVCTFMAYERALHRFVLHSIGAAETMQMRTELTEFFLELATMCHELRNYSASCLIALACDRPTVLPFITKLKLNPAHEQMRATLIDFYTRGNHHMAGYKQALQSCNCPALPGMMLFIREVARGCGSEPYDQHPSFPGSRLINLKRYRPITWAIRAMEKCHAPFKIQRVDYVCDWLDHVLSEYLEGTEAEWEQRIYESCRQL